MHGLACTAYPCHRQRRRGLADLSLGLPGSFRAGHAFGRGLLPSGRKGGSRGFLGRRPLGSLGRARLRDLGNVASAGWDLSLSLSIENTWTRVLMLFKKMVGMFFMVDISVVLLEKNNVELDCTGLPSPAKESKPLCLG